MFYSKEKTPPRIIKAHTDSITAMSAQTNGQLFATCGNDKTQKIWNAFDWGKPFRTFDEAAKDLAFSSDGKWLAIITADRKVKLFDTQSWRSRVLYQRNDGGLDTLFSHPTVEDCFHRRIWSWRSVSIRRLDR